MPGHIKLGGSEGPDPDPLPYLAVSFETRRKDMAKPYESKRSVWCPDGVGGFIEGLKQSEEGEKVTVLFGHENKVFKSSEVAPVNPPKFEKCEDMANLTFLNEASVFWNLKTRYQAKLIYTYSGLFCVVVNPYKRFPIYTQRVIKMYQGRRRNECPPHLWAVTETAYVNMMLTGKNQSMLITGESGAGKTENTKKVISYLAMVATTGKKVAKKVSLEDQIVATNPILESYGNAKTSRNDNSSRFGKFIRIHFNLSGKLAGCDIKAYLFEKSRITQQQEVERSYHIFYQLLQPFIPDMKEKCLLTDDIYDYSYVSQGRTKVESIDDNEELQYTDQAFDIIGFLEDEKWDCYTLTAAVMTMGNLKFKQKGRDEQCEPDKPEIAQTVATLLGVDHEALMNGFVKPRIKVGTEWVIKGQNVEQAMNAVGGIARAIFHRTFLWLIEKCNETLIDTSVKKANFCAVLDIAGFEIFTYNGYEQLSINFVNEKLQQFFNHHMFVVEQEEYISEGINWQMVDFGMDLAACIIMFEKPMGIWAILEEESLFPKATDKTLEDKLKSTMLGKLPTFVKPQSKTDKNAHFAIVHYAGTVSYNVTGWLEKNKDPVNDTVVELLKGGTRQLLVHIWRDHPGQPDVVEDKGEKGKRKKGGGGKTVSSVFLVDLNALMATLNSTDPHFVRCIVPNTCKQPGGVDPPLIMHQLTCNGVLEGIRICMRGFPNRMPYSDFEKRYAIIARNHPTKGLEPKKTADVILSNTPNFDPEKYKLGHSKVFFRAGALAVLEDIRDEIVTQLIRSIQGSVYGYLSRKKYLGKKKQRELILVVQRQFRKYMTLRHWKWFVLIQKTRPLIGVPRMEEELEMLEKKAEETFTEYEEQIKATHIYQAENKVLSQELEEMKASLLKETGDISFQQNKIEETKCSIDEKKNNLKQLEGCLVQEEKAKKEVVEEQVQIEEQVKDVRMEKQELKEKNDLLGHELTQRQRTYTVLNETVTHQDEDISKLTTDKRGAVDKTSKAQEQLTVAEEKLNHTSTVYKQMQGVLEEMHSTTDNEKQLRLEEEHLRRKYEMQLKDEQNKVYSLEKEKNEMEQFVLRIEVEIKEKTDKLDNEQGTVIRSQKHIRELQTNVERMEEELDQEIQAKRAAEHLRSDYARDFEQMTENLEEANLNTQAQIELNQKLDARLLEMRKDKEECIISYETTVLKLRKKHQEAYEEMSTQIDALNRMKIKAEKDILGLNLQNNDTKSAYDKVNVEKVIAEKNLKNLKEKLNGIEKKTDDFTIKFREVDFQNKRLIEVNSDKLSELQKMFTDISILDNDRNNLAHQLQDAKQFCEREEKEYQSLMGRYKTVEHEYDGIKELYEDEQMTKEETVRQMQRATLEAAQWRNKFEKDALEKVQELEMAKVKLQAKLAEAENVIESQNSKLISTEQNKLQLSRAIAELTKKVDEANNGYNQSEKRIRMLDKVISDWKTKADTLSKDLLLSQKNCRNTAAELFRIKNGYEESVIKFEEVKHENTNLSNEIKSITEKITDGGRTIHEIDKQRQKLENDKTDLEALLNDIETALEQEEQKLQTFTLQIKETHEAVNHRINDMIQNFETCKANHTKAMETIEGKVLQESKEKAALFRDRQKLEQDVVEYDAALVRTNQKSFELQKTAKQIQEKLKEKSCLLEVEQENKEAASQYLLNAERKMHAYQNSLEEAKTILDQQDKSRRQAEQDLSDTNEMLTEITVQNNTLSNAIRKLNIDINELKVEKDEADLEQQGIDDKARRFMLEAANIAEELRGEQERAHKAEEEAKTLEARIRDLQAKVDEEELATLRWGEKEMEKLESKYKEVETELEMEKRRLGDASKNFKKTERGISEYSYRLDENTKSRQKMQLLVERLQQQILSYKKQIEEAEEIATLNLSKKLLLKHLLNANYYHGETHSGVGPQGLIDIMVDRHDT